MSKKFLYLLLMTAFLFSSSLGYAVNAQSTKNSIAPINLQAEKNQKVGGTIKEGIHPVKNAQFLIQSRKNSKMYYALTDAQGKFKTQLPDGAYTVKAINQNSSWYSTEETFSVEKGKINSSENQVIQVTEKTKAKEPLHKTDLNIHGVLKEGDKGIKGDLIVSRYTSEYEEEIFIIASKNNGEFSAYLPDGDYYLFGVEVDGGFYRQENYFKVEGSELYVEDQKQSNLTVTLPLKAYNGNISDSSKPLTEAEVILEKVISEEDYYYDFVEYVKTDKKGDYSLRELADGSYSLSVYHQTYYAWEVLKFDVVNGKLYVDGSEVNTLTIKAPDVTLKGKLLEEKTPITTAYISMEGYTEDGDYNGAFDIGVDKKGSFEYRLSDGYYVITSVYENNRQTSLNASFEIQNGKLIQDGEVKTLLTITLPSVTFTGKLLDQETPLQGHVYVENIAGDGNFEWYYASTDENGIYSLRLKDGQYTITGAYLYEENEDVGIFMQFDIQGGKLYVNGEKQDLLELQVPPVSLYGKVLDGENPVSGGYVSISTVEESYYYWTYLDQEGNFTKRLADGDYRINTIDLDDGTNAQINVAFTISNGKLLVNDEEQESLTIALPNVTVQGSLLDAGNPISGSINIYSTTAQNQTYFYGWANEEGRFQLRLPDGEYVLDTIYLFDGTSYTPSTQFTVSSGQLFVDGEKVENFDISIPPKTLYGMVFDGDQIVDYGYVNVMEVGGQQKWYHSWIEGGSYQFRLPDGEYELLSVDTPQGYVTFNKTFTITNGKPVVDGVELDSWDLNLQDGTKK
jgi:hypothetical protein